LEIKNKYITTIPWIGVFENDHFDDESTTPLMVGNRAFLYAQVIDTNNVKS